MEKGKPRPPIENFTYFYDFITILKSRYPYASYAAIAEEIEFVRSVGLTVSGLQPSEEGLYTMIVPIGFGHRAFIELELDRNGIIQPVMGGFIKD
jgi:hypothetical protein